MKRRVLEVLRDLHRMHYDGKPADPRGFPANLIAHASKLRTGQVASVLHLLELEGLVQQEAHRPAPVRWSLTAEGALQ